MQVRKQQLELDMEQQTGFKQEKEFVKESEKVGLKVNIQKTKIMASGLITSWEIDGEKMETVADFIWGERVPKSPQMVTEAMKLKDTYSLEGKL